MLPERQITPLRNRIFLNRQSARKITHTSRHHILRHNLIFTLRQLKIKRSTRTCQRPRSRLYRIPIRSVIFTQLVHHVQLRSRQSHLRIRRILTQLLQHCQRKIRRQRVFLHFHLSRHHRRTTIRILCHHIIRSSLRKSRKTQRSSQRHCITAMKHSHLHPGLPVQTIKHRRIRPLQTSPYTNLIPGTITASPFKSKRHRTAHRHISLRQFPSLRTHILNMTTKRLRLAHLRSIHLQTVGITICNHLSALCPDIADWLTSRSLYNQRLFLSVTHQ